MKKRSKHSNDRKCSYCKVLFSLHKKCKRCRVFLHPKNPKFVCESCHKQHTLESKIKPIYCEDCYINHIK